MAETTEASEPTKLTEEELKEAEDMKANGTVDIRSALIGYAKKFNGYPYISASRIERIPEKGEKHSFLFEQMQLTYLIKNQRKDDVNKVAEKDFMDVFAKGDIIFIQAHASCPTLAADGLYNAMDINGKYIKTQLVGHFVIDKPAAEVSDDEKIEEGYKYFYKDNNEQMMEVQSDVGTPLCEYRKQFGDIYKQLAKPEFEPMIIVKQGNDQFGIIHGNPYRNLSAAETAALLKECGAQLNSQEEPLKNN